MAGSSRSLESQLKPTMSKSALAVSKQLGISYSRTMRILLMLNCPRHEHFFEVDDDMLDALIKVVADEDTPR